MHLDLYHLMGQALEEAQKASLAGEVPVGAVVASQEGEIVARAHNQPIALNDPTAHAEILAIRRAGLACRNYRLSNTVLVVTIEPCVMCMGAAVNARVSRLVYGADDPNWGAAGSLYNLAIDNRLNHRIDVIPGIRDEECRVLMQDFFRARRTNEL
ncbi:MAG: nucleoside deaminase [Deltaproteobacteria bacterium]|nr:nucleoside deaminase [Deltaproteobacteria bacterium]